MEVAARGPGSKVNMLRAHSKQMLAYLHVMRAFILLRVVFKKIWVLKISPGQSITPKDGRHMALSHRKGGGGGGRFYTFPIRR